MPYKYEVTVLTPTYNRGKELCALYDSLLKQTDQGFQWLIVDDGSTDDTAAVVESFGKHDFELTYVKKENGGKHTALNYAHPYINGKLTFVVDSDDLLLPEAIQAIREAWKKYSVIDNVAEVAFNMGAIRDPGRPVAKGFPKGKDVIISNFVDFEINGPLSGDNCKATLTDVLKEFPFPMHENERFIGESWAWMRVGIKYDCVFINRIIYLSEYLEGGLTKQGRAMRIRCPLGGMDYSNSYFLKGNGRAVKGSIQAKKALLFVAYGKFAGWNHNRIVNACNRKDLARLFYLPGCLLYHYWKAKYL